MKATAKDLRLNSGKLLDAVNRGEEVIITFRGKPCARLISCQDTREEAAKNELFGIWKDNDKVQDVEQYIRDLRKGRF